MPKLLKALETLSVYLFKNKTYDLGNIDTLSQVS